MRIWVGCLACYNAGELIGEWIDVAETAEDELTPEFIHGRDTSHEELWVTDFEGFEDLIDGEGSVSLFYSAAELFREAEESYVGVPALVAWLKFEGLNWDDHRAVIEDFKERYVGEYDSGADCAEGELAEIYADVIEALPESLRYRIDWDGVWTDMRASGEYFEADGYYFRSW